MLGRPLPKYRRFSYEPRYYDPKKDQHKHRKIRFKRICSKKSARLRSLFWLVLLLALVIYMITFLSRLYQ